MNTHNVVRSPYHICELGPETLSVLITHLQQSKQSTESRTIATFLSANQKFPGITVELTYIEITALFCLSNYFLTPTIIHNGTLCLCHGPVSVVVRRRRP